ENRPRLFNIERHSLLDGPRVSVRSAKDPQGSKRLQEVAMCYYSLEGPTRDAREDDVLVVEKLTHLMKGLVCPEDPHTGVCLTNGLRLELLFIPENTRKRYRLGLEETATFRMRHWLRRDVLFTDTGARIPIQELEIGQVVRIL